MIQKSLIGADQIPDNLVSAIEERDVVLWIRSFPTTQTGDLLNFIGLPWRLIISEQFNPSLLQKLKAAEDFNSPMTRKRGFLQIIDTDPSRVSLPDRSLPLYLLYGQQETPDPQSFENRLRQMTMLESLRRSSPREILVIAPEDEPIPPALNDLWASGFRCQVTFISPSTHAEESLRQWVQESKGVAVATLVNLQPESVIPDIVHRYFATHPEDRHIIRIRDLAGTLHKLDVTEHDDPERPVLESYSLIEEKDLYSVSPPELSEKEFVSYFSDPSSSWRPYAAGVPWLRDSEWMDGLLASMKKLDTNGADDNCIAYIVAESGAGGTTLARTLAWQCAKVGYPVLLARAVPFVPEALPVRNFITRVNNSSQPLAARNTETSEGKAKEPGARRYEAPWLIVFDTIHWQYRDSDLLRFRNELQKAGRPACVLVVAGPSVPLSYLTGVHFRKVAELNHAIKSDEARALGEHLNKFLKNYGKHRESTEWDSFYRHHTVQYVDGIAAFWVALSFWIQGHYDLSESIQEWMYRGFKQSPVEPFLKEAVLRIAALSSERLPLPEALLPTSPNKWPTSQLLSDARDSFAALGLVRLTSGGDRYWALVHDILGRFLINALYFDFANRSDFGFADARDPEHLRFLLLRKTSKEPLLGERVYQAIGEDFATTIFKIDPDHGHSNFVPMWREVLSALDEMPTALRNSSRLFRHHCAVSRRRIAKLDEAFYGPSLDERASLLNKAIEDLEYALQYIPLEAGSEPNVNLYNSLANAYLDLADVEAERGTTRERLTQLRRSANEATRLAYQESPTNSFVIETYVKNLLQSAKNDEGMAVRHSIDALGVLFSAMSSNEAEYRAAQLGNLASKALEILLKNTSEEVDYLEPKDAVDVLVQAWRTLGASGFAPGVDFEQVPETNKELALQRLSHPAGGGNLQVIHLTYDLTCAIYPADFGRQLGLVEQLVTSDLRIAAQLKLEYAILLFQNNRALEGDKEFKKLRRIWREGEWYVTVPDRLRWLRDVGSNRVRTLSAIIGSDNAFTPVARVQELGAIPVPFRPEEFGMRDAGAGTRFSCTVSFGFKGPFLRPITAASSDTKQVRS
jgi:hypothetical protein